MELFHKGANNSLFIQYGQDVPMLLPDRKESWTIERSKKTVNDSFELEMELNEVMSQVLSQTEYRYIFLYGNFELGEVDVIKKVALKVDGKLTIIASIQDNTVLDGQIIIEEIR
ncbi:hypothetical protein BC351_00730 [Paenibacillus ferrarius]|uniref:Uncharacterized protein n=2 Tax=Paenibacillus ferrarius TaxID=1469647 RepID=A0A1V4HSN4_9BACL|nr:hypothetical protein BC351_00730 [Paenibacillus ferrarius]